MPNPLDIVYSKLNADGTKFNEMSLVPVPNSLVGFDDCGNLTTTNGQNSISASYSGTSSLIQISVTSSNNDYYIPFVVGSEAQSVYIDTSSIYYNPELDLLTVNHISCSDLIGTASFSTLAEFVINSGVDVSSYLSSSEFYAWTGSNISQFSGTASFASNIFPIDLNAYLSSSWTGSNVSQFFGTSSYALSSSNAISSSWAPFIPIDVSMYLSSSWTGSNISQFSGTASFASNINPIDLNAYLSSSWTGSNTSRFYGTSSYALSASWSPSIDISTYLSSSWTGSNISRFYGTASYSLSSSQTISSSYWDSSSINTWVNNNYQIKLSTGSTYPITSSVSVTASYWDSSSLLTGIGNIYQIKLVTGSTYPITSSWATSSLSASYLTTTNNYQINVLTASIITANQITGSLLYGTSSWTLNLSGGVCNVSGNIILLGYVVNTTSAVSSNTNLIGTNAGYNASGINNSNFIGYQAGYTANSANYSNFFGNNAGYNATSAYESNFFGDSAGNGSGGSQYSNFFGYAAGFSSPNANNSNFFGQWAGSGTNANNSNFLGQGAGQNATNANNSNFLGNGAGNGVISANNSNFFGQSAGNNAKNASGSNFFGTSAGQNATSGANSIFIGYQAGSGATNANNSIFIGYNAGYNNNTLNNLSSQKSSILIGDYTSTNGYSDSIAIGKGTASPNSQSLNLGNVIYATGIYTASISSSTPQVNGKVGIGINAPVNAFDVVGNISASVVTASLFYGTSSRSNNAISSSIASTSSYIWNTGSQMVIVETPNYYQGTKLQNISQSYSEVLTITLNPLSTAYVMLTYHGVDSTYGPALYKGEFAIQKDTVSYYGQPGAIISQYNNNPNVNVQAQIPTCSFTNSSTVFSIQLKTASTGTTGSLIYKIQGQFLKVGDPFIG